MKNEQVPFWFFPLQDVLLSDKKTAPLVFCQPVAILPWTSLRTYAKTREYRKLATRLL
jgi:hypothetical protein